MEDSNVMEKVEELFKLVAGVGAEVAELKSKTESEASAQSASKRAEEAERQAFELSGQLEKARADSEKNAQRIKMKTALEAAFAKEGAVDVEAAMLLAGINDEKLDGLFEIENKGENALAQTVASLKERRPYIFKKDGDDAPKAKLETPPTSARNARNKNENIPPSSKLAARVYEAAARELGEKVR